MGTTLTVMDKPVWLEEEIRVGEYPSTNMRACAHTHTFTDKSKFFTNPSFMLYILLPWKLMQSEEKTKNKWD